MLQRRYSSVIQMQSADNPLLHSAVKFVHSFATTSFLSKTFVHWLNALLFVGFRRPLALSDLGKITTAESTAWNFQRLRDALDAEKRLSFQKNRRLSLWHCFWRLTSSQMLMAGLFRLISGFLVYVPPLSLDVIITFVESQRTNATDLSRPPIAGIRIRAYFDNGYVMAFIAFAALVVHMLLFQHSSLISVLAGIRCKCAVQAAVFDKCLRLQTSHLDEGRIMNHLTVDPVHIVTFFNVAHYIWTLPIQVITGFVILYMQLGRSVLISSFMLLLLVPVQYVLAWKLSDIHRQIMELADRRLKTSTEILQSIKLVKLYAWEKLLERSVTAARRCELWMMMRAALVRVVSSISTDGIPYIACLLTFVLYNRLETEPLNASKVFSCLALFSYISNQLFVVTIVINIAGLHLREIRNISR